MRHHANKYHNLISIWRFMPSVILYIHYIFFREIFFNSSIIYKYIYIKFDALRIFEEIQYER